MMMSLRPVVQPFDSADELTDNWISLDEMISLVVWLGGPAGSFAPRAVPAAACAALRWPGRPGQVFAIGLNYRGHAEESGMAIPDSPAVFTKFPASLAGPQFSLGKSWRGYGPVGPWVVTLEEIASPDDLALGCSLNGEKVQQARTSDLIFSVPRLIAELSAVLPLLPGDVLETWVEGIGHIRNRLITPN